MPLKYVILWTGNFGWIVKRDGSRWLHLTSIKRGFSDFIKEVRGFIKSPLCSACDLPMRPKRLVHSGNGLFEFQYECANCEAKETVSEIAERRNGT